MTVHYISNIRKDYKHMIRVLVYNEPKPIFYSDNATKRDKSQVDNDTYEPSIQSLRRTRSMVRDLIINNDFDMFATFTFDPKKVYDRFSYQCCWSRFQRWVHNQHVHSPDLRYIVVPEQHKNGAWHFHALLGAYNGNIKDSKHYSSSGHKVYNITSYRSGFSTMCYIDDSEVVAQYLMKYITKDYIRRFNQRRFTCSNNLSRPTVTKNAIIDFKLPHKEIYKSGEYSLYEFPTY